MERYGGDGFGASHQTPARFLDAQPCEELVGRLAIDLIKHANEMESAQTRDIRKRVERQIGAQVGLHVIA
jgi:hypothetical protein